MVTTRVVNGGMALSARPRRSPRCRQNDGPSFRQVFISPSMVSRATRPSPLIVSPEIFRLVTKLRRSFSEALVCSGIAAAQRWRIVYEATSAPQPEFELPGVSGAAHVEGERLSRRAITFVAVPANMACRRSSRARAERPVPSLN